ncbi:hypothetical protein ACFWAP_00310 [Streptomyces goshikiensis]|uniref:hypothetical protein n=1 Tax=Streptomyces goshikiensis TaxID=1942 RepID=UPI0036536826
MSTIDLSSLASQPADAEDELTPEQREKLRRMGEDAGISDQGRLVETAFLVVITPDGQVVAEPDVTTPVRLRRRAGFDDFQRAGHVLVDDALAIKTASLVGQQMAQITSAMVDQQRTQALVNSLKL